MLGFSQSCFQGLARRCILTLDSPNPYCYLYLRHIKCSDNDGGLKLLRYKYFDVYLSDNAGDYDDRPDNCGLFVSSHLYYDWTGFDCCTDCHYNPGRGHNDSGRGNSDADIDRFRADSDADVYTLRAHPDPDADINSLWTDSNNNRKRADSHANVNRVRAHTDHHS